jgi:hypothetical protein
MPIGVRINALSCRLEGVLGMWASAPTTSKVIELLHYLQEASRYPLSIASMRKLWLKFDSARLIRVLLINKGEMTSQKFYM